MSPNAKFLCYVKRLRSPKFNKLNLGDVQKSGVPADMRPVLFPRVPEEFSLDVGPLKWESRLLIFYFCTNIVTVSYICLLREFWHFLNFG